MTTDDTDATSPDERAALSVEGVSIGDAFGERFFECRSDQQAREAIEARELPEAPWRYTDDTVMALGIAEVLREAGELDQEHLADVFAERYRREPRRGYGSNARRLLQRVAEGEDWSELSHEAFGGEGSFGNGAAMRVTPVGGYFADDLDDVVEAARQSAEITHAHPEGIAGAIAVAVAAAVAWRTRGVSARGVRHAIMDEVLERTPESSEVYDRLERADDLEHHLEPSEVADELGSGQRVTAMDTVPFVVWCAAHYVDDVEEAMWQTVSGLGDRDTTSAMVGGIVALRTGRDAIPDEWRDRREALDW